MLFRSRGIIFAYILCGTFLVAHIINAVIAEALSVPSGLVRPSPGSDREDEAKTSASAMIESIQKSGLFPLPPDPVSASATGSGAPPPPPRVPLNLASKLKLLGVVMGDHEGVSAIVEELSSKRQLFFRLHATYLISVRSVKSVETGWSFGRAINRNSLNSPPRRSRSLRLLQHPAHQPLLKRRRVQRVRCSIEESLSKPWMICPNYCPRREPCQTS